METISSMELNDNAKDNDTVLIIIIMKIKD